MTNQEAIASLRTLCHTCKFFPKCAYEKPECFQAIELAISALQAQDVPDTNVGDMISRQAAIDALRKIAFYHWFECGEYIGENPREFLIMNANKAFEVIECLPPAQPDPCEDAVSRKDAIIQLSHNKNGDPDCDVIIQHDIETLKQLPSVTPKRKTGTWTLLEECANAGYYCSECRKKVVKEGWSGTVKKIKFCPNCGADMRQREENK